MLVRRIVGAGGLAAIAALAACSSNAAAGGAPPTTTMPPATSSSPVEPTSSTAPASSGSAGSSGAPAPGGTSSSRGAGGPSGAGQPVAQVATTVPTFEIDAVEGMRFALPKTTAPAGPVRMELVNADDDMPHLAQLFELHPGVTMKQFTAELLSPGGEGAVMPIATAAGGPDAVGPGRRNAVVVDLVPSRTYAVICTVPGKDGKPHYAHGMITSFTTAKTAGGARPAAPASTIEMSDFKFVLPAALDWSKPIKVVDTGKQPHEMQIFGAAPGKTLADVKAYLTAKPGSAPPGPPPYRGFGGVAAIMPGAHEQFDPHLPAGSYLLVCFVDDPVSHLPHFMKGMLATITVS